MGVKLSYLFAIIYLTVLNVGIHSSPPFILQWFNQTVDHFDFQKLGSRTFSQRYLIQDKWWPHDGNGPIFFYTGNEGDIVDFWDSAGFIFDLAPSFHALVIFAEHRYYGQSLPFGDDSFSRTNIGLLTIEQALADYAMLLTFIKRHYRVPNSPVIAFGGSYGGMLSAYMRFKYPNIVLGAVACSAPIYMMDPDFDRSFFFPKVTQDFRAASEQCYRMVKQGFADVNTSLNAGQHGLNHLSSTFQLCQPLYKSVAAFRHFKGWIRNAFVYLAMFDYPYPTDFLGARLPANPVQAACDVIQNASDAISGLAAVVGLFYTIDDSQGLQCYDSGADFVECADPTGCGVGPSAWAWDYQVCVEFLLPDGSNNETDMFPELRFTFEMKMDYCRHTWGVTPLYDWPGIQFWGKNIHSASNVLFSNGNLDPWAGGGVTTSVSDSLIAVPVIGGAHHLDLREPNALDPPGVIKARYIERQYIQRWILKSRLNRT